jgi:predicted nucleic acid-binding Zn ribbon protein/DNA-directed RNA polymerase subunit RPC12/RpoP
MGAREFLAKLPILNKLELFRGYPSEEGVGGRRTGSYRSLQHFYKLLGGGQTDNFSKSDIRWPAYPVSMQYLADMANFSQPVNICRLKLKQELFGGELPIIEPAFKVKCSRCNTKYEDYIPKRCEECGTDVFIKPDVSQKEFLKKTLFDTTFGVNKNKQLFTEVCEELEDDHQVFDQSWLILHKEYGIDNETGEIITTRVKEMTRGDPRVMRFIATAAGDLGGKWLICPIHRKRPYPYQDPVSGEAYTHCEICGAKLHDVKVVSIYHTGYTLSGAGEPNRYYIDGEVIAASKYFPSLTYGYPQTLSLWLEISTYYMKTKFIYKYYKDERIPKGIIMVPTLNQNSLQDMWNWTLKMVARNPHHVPTMGYDGGNKGAKPEFIQFMNNMADNQFMDVRQDLERIISAVYGVSGVYRHIQKSGATNAGLDVTVTNKAIQYQQRVWNFKIFPALLHEFGITDWNLKLPQPEQKDQELAEKVKLIKAQRAKVMESLGFEIEKFDHTTGEFEFTEKPIISLQDRIGGDFEQGTGEGTYEKLTNYGTDGGLGKLTPPVGQVGTRTQSFEGQPEMPIIRNSMEFTNDELEVLSGFRDFVKTFKNDIKKSLEKKNE